VALLMAGAHLAAGPARRRRLAEIHAEQAGQPGRRPPGA